MYDEESMKQKLVFIAWVELYTLMNNTAHMLKEYSRVFSQREYISSLFASLIFLIVSLVINWHAGIYATVNASNPVTDIVLSNMRTFAVDGIFVFGTIFFWAFMVFLGLKDPKTIPFLFASVALFVVVRSLFISLTHIGPFPTQIVVDSNVIDKFAFGGDLFFSGHTGLPYLMALVFWRNTLLRAFFILSSISFGIIVLLAHLHYSIDVLSAFFITYTIYHMAERLFKKEREIFYGN